MIEISESTQREFESVVEQLPQFKNGVIKEEDAFRWAENTLIADPGRLVWHAKRLEGWGASDIGHLVTALRGDFDAFKGAPRLVMEKLMKIAPDAPSGASLRGLEMEDLIRQKFLKKFSAKQRPDLHKGYHGFKSRQYSWLKGNPDDIVEINSKIFIVDYKAPGSESFKKSEAAEGVNFDYACQLHHLHKIAAELGIQVDGLLIAALDFDAWEVESRLIDFNPDLMNEILQAGDHYWNEYVMQGLIPDPIYKPTFNLSLMEEHESDAVLSLSTQLVCAKALYNSSMDLVESITKQIKGITEKFVLEGRKIVVPGGSINARVGINAEEVISLCKGNSIEPPDPEDKASLAKALESLSKIEPEIDLSRCLVENHVISLTRAQKGKDRELIDNELSIADTLVKTHINERYLRLVTPNDRSGEVFGEEPHEMKLSVVNKEDAPKKRKPK